MIVKMKKVYYCEYCNKHSLRPLIKHEKHCTKNPDRECRLCGTGSIKHIIEKYKIDLNELEKECIKKEVDAYTEIGKILDEKIKKVECDVGFCPICTLTVIRCNGWNKYNIDYKYDEKLIKWWTDVNAEDFSQFSIKE